MRLTILVWDSAVLPWGEKGGPECRAEKWKSTYSSDGDAQQMCESKPTCNNSSGLMVNNKHRIQRGVMC